MYIKSYFNYQLVCFINFLKINYIKEKYINICKIIYLNKRKFC